MIKLAKIGAFTAIAVGIFGMLFCFPFLWSARIPDLIGAGLPFVAGAIIASAGLIALAILVKGSNDRLPS